MRRSWIRPLQWLPAALVCSAVAVRASDPGEQRFLWAEANTRLAAAQNAVEYKAAARSYMRLVEAGVRNGPLFFNLGAAQLKAGEYDAARGAMLRAERYMGTSPGIERNLILAMARGQSPENVNLPWYRPLLLWHYGIPAAARIEVAAVAFALCWIALILRRLGAREAGAQLLLLSLLVLAIFGTSGAASWWQEQRDDAAGFTTQIRGASSNAAKPAT